VAGGGRAVTSWVLEDDFSDGRPPLEEAGVLLVDDVSPYELMKLRLLNASHQSLCYFAYLSGYRLVHEAAGDSLFAEFLLNYMDSEATPDAQAGAGNRPARVQTNPDRAVREPRGAGHHRPPVRRLIRPDPQVAAAGDPGEPVHRRTDSAGIGDGGELGPLCRGVDEQGQPIEVVDQLAESLIPIAQSQHENPHRVHRGHRGVRGFGHRASVR